MRAETTLNLYEPAKKPVKASSMLYRPPKPSFKGALNELQSHPPSPQTPTEPRFKGLGFRGLGFRGLGFRGLGVRGLGFRGLGFRVIQALITLPSKTPMHPLQNP